VKLAVRLTRLSKTHHRFEAIREDGTREVRELETRSFLLHDLVHFALESEGRLDFGFYGSLARGAGYETPAACEVESVVGPLQGASRYQIDPAAFVARLRDARASAESTTPAWLSEELIARTIERLRQLRGQWRSTPFGQTMELMFAV